MKNGTVTLKVGLAVSYKAKQRQHNPVIAILGIYEHDLKMYVYMKTLTAFFITTKMEITKTVLDR